MKKVTKFTLLLTLFVFLVSVPKVNAQQEVNKLQFTSETKEKYYEDLVQKRLAELKYIVDKDSLDELERSTQRLSFQVGTLTDYIVNKNLNNKKISVRDLYKKDKIILEKLRDKYPANSSFWMLVQHTINSIDINLQKL